MTVVSKHSVRLVCLRLMELLSAYPDYTTPYTYHHFLRVQLFAPVILLPLRNYQSIYTIQLNAIRVGVYTECNRRNVRDFGRVFVRSNYTDITQNTYIQS